MRPHVNICSFILGSLLTCPKYLNYLKGGILGVKHMSKIRLETGNPANNRDDGQAHITPNQNTNKYSGTLSVTNKLGNSKMIPLLSAIYLCKWSNLYLEGVDLEIHF